VCCINIPPCRFRNSFICAAGSSESEHDRRGFNCLPCRRGLYDCFQLRLRLQAEILVLRHKLNALQQRAPRQLHLRCGPTVPCSFCLSSLSRILDTSTIRRQRNCRALAPHECPNPRKLKRLTATANRAILLPMSDLAGWIWCSVIGLRPGLRWNRDTLAFEQSTQRAAPQIPSDWLRSRDRPGVSALYHLAPGVWTRENSQAAYGDPLAPRWVPSRAWRGTRPARGRPRHRRTFASHSA